VLKIAVVKLSHVPEFDDDIYVLLFSSIVPPDMAVQVSCLIQIGDPSALQLRQLVAVHIAALGAGTVPLTAPVTL
jgi:hypothetical protein